LPLSLPFPKTCRVRRLYSKQHVLQNIMVPLSDLQEALKLVDKEMKVIGEQIFLKQRIFLFRFTLSGSVRFT